MIGILDTLSAPFRSRPKPPPFQADPFVGSSGFQKGLKNVNTAATQALLAYLGREPGFSADEIDAMYELPAEQTKVGEQAALRRLNQGSAYRGNYRGGARLAGRGAILGAGMATRANLRRQVILDAARAALADRLNQLSAAAQYTNPRMSASLGHTGMRNQQGFQSYLAELGQYNADFDQAMNFLLPVGKAGVEKAVMAGGI